MKINRYPGDAQTMLEDLGIAVHVLSCSCPSCSDPRRRYAVIEHAFDVVTMRLAFQYPSSAVSVDLMIAAEEFTSDLLDKATRWRYN